MCLSKNSQCFATSPSRHWAAIGCTENGQPIRVTVHTQISVQMSCCPTCRGWIAMNWEKNTFLIEHPVTKCTNSNETIQKCEMNILDLTMTDQPKIMICEHVREGRKWEKWSVVEITPNLKITINQWILMFNSCLTSWFEIMLAHWTRNMGHPVFIQWIKTQ